MKKTTTLFLAFFALTSLANAQSFLQKGTDIDGEAEYDFSGCSVSMPDANTIAIGALYNSQNESEAGHVRIYHWNGSTWVQKGSDIDGEASEDYSGYSVSMPSANTVAIGAPGNSGNGTYSGHVRIYDWNGTAWVQRGSDIDGEAADDFSGIVSMPDNNTVAIGALQNDGNGSDAGHVRIYSWNGSAWIQKGSDIDGEATGDFAGIVSMPDENTVAIGATENDGNGSNSGHVRVYRWNGSNWVQKGIDIDGEFPGDLSGSSVSMPDSNTIAIGAPEYYNFAIGFDVGQVRIYNWTGSEWMQKGLDIDGEAAGDYSGSVVIMPDINTVAITAPYNSGNGIESGHVRVYNWSGTAWIPKGIDIDGEVEYNYSGSSISMPDNNTIAIGAVFNSDNGDNSGHTRVFSYSSSSSGILENDFGKELTFYPNPTIGELNIDLGTNHNEVTVIITNALGQDVLKKSFEGSNLLELNIPGEAGMYFIEVRSADKKALLKVVKE